ncbi:MAG: orotate phosphoribosyltransferase [Candidatus Margulisiibacteriota bacterium]|jgi:orotate phosphoribosyltransferase
MFTSSELLKEIKKVAFLEGDFTTRAGKKTNYYIDKYLFETKPGILDAVTDYILELLPPSNAFDRIAAPELGAVALAALTSIKADKPFLIVKKQSKEYGTQKLIEGEFKPHEKVVVLEDILTTGGAVLKAIDVLLANNLEIVSIIGVINREEGAFENINERGFLVKALFNKTELLNS